MSRGERYDDDIEDDRARDYYRQDRPRRRRKKRQGSPIVPILIVVGALVFVLGIVVVLVTLLPNWTGRGSSAGSVADQLIDTLAGEWEGGDLDGQVVFQFRKNHTATLITVKMVVQYTWELESATENSLIIRTTAEGTGRTKFVFLSNNEVRLESLKVNKAIVLRRKR
jgi:hypothetical protein